MAKSKKRGTIPVTKIRILIPKGMPIAKALRKIELSFKEVGGDVEGQFGSQHCCVDAAVVSPVSTISKS